MTKTNLNQLAEFLVDETNKFTFLNNITRNLTIVHSQSSDRWKEKAFPKIRKLCKTYTLNYNSLLLEKALILVNRSSKSDYLIQVETQINANRVLEYKCVLRPKKCISIKDYPSVEDIVTFNNNLSMTYSPDKEKSLKSKLFKPTPCSKIVIRLEKGIRKDEITITNMLGTYRNKSYLCVIYPITSTYRADYIPNIYVPDTNLRKDTYPTSLATFKSRGGIFHYWAWDNTLNTFLLESQ